MHCLSYNIRNPHLNPVLFLPTKTYVDAADTQAHTHTHNPTSRVLLLGHTFMLAYVISTIGSADSICMVILVLPEAALIKSTYFLVNLKAECRAMPHRRAAGKPKAKSRRKRNNRHTQAVSGIPFADPNDAEELFDSGSESPRMPPHGPPKGPPPPRPVNGPPDDADVATRPHHGPKGPPPTGPPPKGPPPKGPPPKGPAPKGPPPKGPPPGTAVNQPDRPPPAPNAQAYMIAEGVADALHIPHTPIMVRFEPSQDTVRAGDVVLVTLSAPTPEFLENSGLNQTHCAMCFCGLEGAPPPTIEETDIPLGVPWPPVTPEGRVPCGGVLEGRVPRGGALEGRVPRGRARKRRIPRGGTLERIPEGGSPGGGTNSGDELVRELDQEARDVLEGRVPLGMEGGLPGGGPDRVPVGMDLEDSDEDLLHSTSSSTDSDYSIVDMDDDE